MERPEAFETMLEDIRRQAAYEKQKMEELRRAGKERSATYRQYPGNRMLYRTMPERYKAYGLPDEDADI